MASNKTINSPLTVINSQELQNVDLQQQVKYWKEEYFKLEARFQSILKANEPVTGEPNDIDPENGK